MLQEIHGISFHPFILEDERQFGTRIIVISSVRDSNQNLNRQANRRETSNWGIRIESCSRSPLYIFEVHVRASVCARGENLSL